MCLPSLDKMKFQTYLFLMITSSSFVQAQIKEHLINVSCLSIKTDDGYKYSYNCPAESQIYVYMNETALAKAMFGSLADEPMIFPPVTKFEPNSLFTEDCQELQIKCLKSKGKDSVEETRWNFNITRDKNSKQGKEEKEDPNPRTDSQLGLTIGVSIAVLAVIAVLGGILWHYCWPKKSQSDNPDEQGAILRGVQVSSPDPQAGAESPEDGGPQLSNNGHKSIPNGPSNQQDTQGQHEGGEVMVVRGDLDQNHNTVLSPDPQAGAETRQTAGLDQVCNGGTLLSNNMDSEADAEMSTTPCLDHYICDEGTASYNEDKCVPDVHSTQRNMHRNLRGDPGGVNYMKAQNSVRMEKQIGWTHGGRSPEDDKDAKNEEQPLLPFQGAAIQPPDTRGEAANFVSGHNPDQVCRKPAPMETEVDSGPDGMMNINIEIH